MTAAPRGRAALGSLLFTAFLWLIAFIVLVEALGFRYPANIAPLVTGGAATLLLSAVLVQGVLRFMRPAPPPEAVSDTRLDPASPVAPISDPAGAEAAAQKAIAAATTPSVVGTILPDLDPAAERHEKAALLWTFASLGLLLLFGFLIGMTVAMLGLLRVYGRESWLMSIVATTLVMVTLYVAFGVFLRIAFFPGLVPDLLGIG